jgi:hypothetical protein
MQRDPLLDNTYPQPGPGDSSHIFGPVEILENPGLIFYWNTYPVILNFDYHPVILITNHQLTLPSSGEYLTALFNKFVIMCLNNISLMACSG